MPVVLTFCASSALSSSESFGFRSSVRHEQVHAHGAAIRDFHGGGVLACQEIVKFQLLTYGV